MARRKTKREQEETLLDLVEVREKAENFFEENQRILSFVLGGVLVLVGAFVAYKFLYLHPREKEATNQIFQAEMQFQRDSFELALVNPGGGYSGFLDIIDNYKGTKTANLAKYYTGVSYLHLGRFEASISYLKDFKAGGKITPIMKFGALGDAYSELENYDEAISYYKKAISSGDNNFLTPYYLKKLGLLQERRGDLKGALTTYKKIREDYANSQEGVNIEKFILRIEDQI